MTIHGKRTHFRFLYALALTWVLAQGRSCWSCWKAARGPSGRSSSRSPPPPSACRATLCTCVSAGRTKPNPLFSRMFQSICVIYHIIPFSFFSWLVYFLLLFVITYDAFIRNQSVNQAESPFDCSVSIKLTTFPVGIPHNIMFTRDCDPSR